MTKARLIDLDKEQLGLLESIIKSHIPDKTVWAYGSRVTWKAGETSDLDLVAFGCNSTEIFDLKEAFEESDLLMSVDVMNWETIPEKFKENIRKKHMVLQEKQEPKGWRKVKLGEIASIEKKVWKVGDANLPYIGLEHISEGKLRLISFGNSKNLASNKYYFEKGDILFGKLRPYFRKVIKPQFDGVCSTDIWVIKPKVKVDKNYLFYFFANKKLVDTSYKSSSGTRMPRADWNLLKNTEWLIPDDITEQKAIAEVLSSLDDKIDLLHRQNKTLEDMAQTLFRQWFIEEADKNWKERKLCETASFSKGRKPKRAEAAEFQDSEPQILIETFDTGKTLYAERKKMVVACSKDILMVMDGASSGRVEIGFEGVLGSTIGLYRPLDNFKYPFFIFCFLKFQEKYIRENTTGSAIPHVDNKLVLSLMLRFPDIEKVSEFESIAESFFAKKQSNKNQICTLEKQRDILLPKLISGEARVTH